MALAAEADPLAVVDARRGSSTSSRRSSSTRPAPSQLGARRLDLAAGAAAGRARLRADELAEDAARHLLQPPDAAAGRARRHLAAGLGAVAVAVRARDRDLERHLAASFPSRPRRARSRPSRRDRRRASGRAPAEQVVAEERREEIGEAAEVEVARAGSRRCAGPRGRSGRRARASRTSRAPRRPRRPRGSAPPRRARRRRRGAARARAARKAFLISASLASRATPRSS